MSLSALQDWTTENAIFIDITFPEWERSSRRGRSAAHSAGEVSTAGADGAFGTFGLGAFAQLLSVAFQQQVCTGTSIEGLRDFSFDCLLRFAIGHTVVLVLASTSPVRKNRTIARAKHVAESLKKMDWLCQISASQGYAWGYLSCDTRQKYHS